MNVPMSKDSPPVQHISQNFLWRFRPVVSVFGDDNNRLVAQRIRQKTQRINEVTANDGCEITEHRSINATTTYKPLMKIPPQMSPPLRWSKKFGEEGRRVKEKITKTKTEMLKKATIPPPGQCKELVEIIDKISKLVIKYIIHEIQIMTSFAIRYRDDSNSIYCGYHNKQSLLDSLLITYEQYQVLNNSEDRLTLLQTTTQQISTITLEEIQSFMNILSLISCIPNQSNIRDTISIYLWLITYPVYPQQSYTNNNNDSDDYIHRNTNTFYTTANTTLFDFTKYTELLSNNIDMLTDVLTTRGAAGPNKTEIKIKKQAELLLKYWYTDDLKICEKSSYSSDTLDNNATAVNNIPTTSSSSNSSSTKNKNDYKVSSNVATTIDGKNTSSSSSSSRIPQPPSMPPPSSTTTAGATSSSSSSSSRKGYAHRQLMSKSPNLTVDTTTSSSPPLSSSAAKFIHNNNASSSKSNKVHSPMNGYQPVAKQSIQSFSSLHPPPPPTSSMNPIISANTSMMTSAPSLLHSSTSVSTTSTPFYSEMNSNNPNNSNNSSSSSGGVGGTSRSKSPHHYPIESSSPGHMKALTQSILAAASTHTQNISLSNMNQQPILSSRNNLNEMMNSQQQQQSMNRFMEKVEHVLVKVMTHKGLTSFVQCMHWDDPYIDENNNMNQHNKEISGNSTHMGGTGHIIRCKVTDNTASTSEILDNISQMIHQSLRVFGANILIEDILEEPAPPEVRSYQASLQHKQTTMITQSLSQHALNKVNQKASTTANTSTINPTNAANNPQNNANMLLKIPLSTKSTLNNNKSSKSLNSQLTENTPTTTANTPAITPTSSILFGDKNKTQKKTHSPKKGNNNTAEDDDDVSENNATMHPSTVYNPTDVIQRTPWSPNSTITSHIQTYHNLYTAHHPATTVVNTPTINSTLKSNRNLNTAPNKRNETPNRAISSSSSSFIPSSIDPVCMYHQSAPPLNKRQWEFLMIALLSDYMRTIILNISILVKHTWAGEELHMNDIMKVFGTSICKVIGKNLLQELLLWLIANRKTEATFKLAHQTYTETALHNLFSYWPEVMINVTQGSSSNTTNHDMMDIHMDNMDMDNDDDNDPLNTSDYFNTNCSVRLYWPHRHRILKVFREPHLFVPNSSVI